MMLIQVLLLSVIGLVGNTLGFLNILRPGCGSGQCQGPQPQIPWGPGPGGPCLPGGQCQPQGPCLPGQCQPQGPFIPNPGNPCTQGQCAPQNPPAVMKPYGWQYGGKSHNTPAPTNSTLPGCVSAANGICTATCTIGAYTQQNDNYQCTTGVCCTQPSG